MPAEKGGYENVEDTFAEAFSGLYVRLLITGERGLKASDRSNPGIEYDELRLAAYRCTATPSVVVGRIEGGIERWLTRKQTPDNREGVVVQLWGRFDENEDIPRQLERFYKEMSIRIRQDVLSVSTTRVFALPHPGGETSEGNLAIDTEERIGKCGGGYEWFSSENGRETINVPLMMGYDFKTDRYLRCGIGVSGGNLWLLCDSVETGRKAGRKVLEAIKQVEGVITPFYVCPSGSAAEDYPPIGPPTNYLYCSTLRDKLKNRTKVPIGVKSIPEIVVDGVSLDAVKKALKKGMKSVHEMDGVIKISAGNYGGKLGRYKIYLRELLSQL
ncbi:MAG: formylmethanofuran--tetrahydromethanopterin formyltransferase [Promethearchaeati archaeon SRVP18_Atabeyarchaeia-1]